MLHSPVLFVGDRPNPRKNLDLATPFVGTTSYRTLLDWIYKMDLDVGLVTTVNAYDLSGELTKGFRLALAAVREAEGTKIVSLGQNAAAALVELQEAHLHLPFFQLPHPSGLNLALNDKKALSAKLALCKKYIYL